MVRLPFEKSPSRLRPGSSKNSNYRSHDRRCCQQAESRKIGNNIHVRSVLFSALTNLSVPLFIMIFIVRKYVESMKDSTQLLDLLAAVGSEDLEPTRAAAGRQVLYPDVRFSHVTDYFILFVLTLCCFKYLPTVTLLAGVKAGGLHQGHFNANQYNYLEGSVQVPAFTKPVLLIGRENMNRAVNGDVVVIEVFDKKEWKASADEVVDQDGKRVFIIFIKDPCLRNINSYIEKRRC